MGYRRRRYYKRRRKSNQFLSGVGKAIDIGSRALSLATTVASLINVEFKRNDMAGSHSITTTGSVTQMGQITGGSDAVSRVGNEVELKSLYLKGGLQRNAGASYSNVRIMLVHDKENTGSIPAITDILESNSVFSLPKWDNRKRFKLMKDVKLDFGDNTMRDFSFYKNFGTKGFKLEWTNTTSASTKNNALYLVLLSDEETNGVSFTWKARHVFIDN